MKPKLQLKSAEISKVIAKERKPITQSMRRISSLFMTSKTLVVKQVYNGLRDLRREEKDLINDFW